jgi:tungstate transport system ATP-binding protein
MTALFDLQQVTVQYGQVHALQSISLQILQGQRLALIGANGSGKSTLLRLLNGLVAHSSYKTVGQCSVHPSVNQGMLFQRPHMLRMTVENNVALGLWLKGMTWALAKTRALAALERVNLRAEAARSAKSLSMGQQQRVAFARALAQNPNVLLLDEPTASMDPHAKRDVEALMQAYANSNAGANTLIFASHNLGQVKRLATHVAYLEQGKLLVFLPVGDFFDGLKLDAVSPEAAAFLKGEVS